MASLSGNSCNIITLLPLGLECDSISASTPESTNGLIALYITGGTSPYNVTWNNGAQGTLLTNLSPGSYTATVVDYYGDFTATTTCNVGYVSFYLETFENCSIPGSYAYYLADLVNPIESGSTYQLTTQLGCWTSSGTTLYTGQTYIGSYPVVSSGPFTGCTECLPEPTPTPVYPNELCLEYTRNNTNSVTQYSFSSGATINGYPSWTSSTQTIYYNTGTTQWNILGWTYPSNAYFQSPTIPPTGNWTLVGPTSFGYSVYVYSGPCQTPQLNMVLAKTNPACSTINNGTISVTANGGLPPYTYSIDSVNYQSSNTFIGLAPGTYTVYTKDSNVNIVSQTTTLVAQQTYQNYNVSLTLTPGAEIVVGNATTKTSNWSINVSPYPLPSGVVINMNLVFNIYTTVRTLLSPYPVITYSNNITANQTGSFTVTSPTTTTPVGSTVINPSCHLGVIKTSAYTSTYGVQLSNGGTLSGTIVQYINTPCVSGDNCNLNGEIGDTVSLQNITISPTQCKSVTGPAKAEMVGLIKTGLIC